MTTADGELKALCARWMTAFMIVTTTVVLPAQLFAAAIPGGPARMVQAAREQIGKTVRYDPSYRVLAYPNGDVPTEAGVCTDVVVRALRASLGLDLQQLVHEDMKTHFQHYPKNWGLKKPDRNIDHRRVPNLQTYFKQRGWELPVSKKAGAYRAGDLVTCIVPPNLPHIMIVSDRSNAGGRPLVIHNIGAGVQEEDRLGDFKITGHYRIPEISADAARSTKKPASNPR